MIEKLLTIVVPSYNVEKYIERCLDTLIVCPNEVEIIVVNDGSIDKTEEIAINYQNEHPGLVKVISKPNGGHGSTINKGLEIATGEYFLVVDSDDWLEEKSLKKLVNTIIEIKEKKLSVDMFIANCVYEHVEDDTHNIVKYKNVFPINEIFTWNDVKIFKPFQFLFMHSVIQKTQILRDCKFTLPEHTFYVDNLLVYVPLPYFKNMYYLDIDLYRYFIGRNEQSVSHESMIKRIDQYLRVVKLMIESHHLENIENRKLKKYMYNYLTMILTIVNTFLTFSKTKENDRKKKELWKYLKTFDKEMYAKISIRPVCAASKLSGKSGRMIIKGGYLIGRKIFKFN